MRVIKTIMPSLMPAMLLSLLCTSAAQAKQDEQHVSRIAYPNTASHHVRYKHDERYGVGKYKNDSDYGRSNKYRESAHYPDYLGYGRYAESYYESAHHGRREGHHHPHTAPVVVQNVVVVNPLPVGWYNTVVIGRPLPMDIYHHGHVLGYDDRGYVLFSVEGRVLRLLRDTHEIIEILKGF